MHHHFSFNNRVGVVATMHHKEKVMAPILEKELGINVVVPDNFNTDAFGTFTREIKRTGDQLEAARRKAKEALAVTQESLAFASEGTFAPHPGLPYISCNREIVVLIDTLNDLEVVGQEFSTITNFNHKSIATIEEALVFAEKVGFPEHGLVVMDGADSEGDRQIIKGIIRENQLIEAVELILHQSSSKKAHIETDMRALYNPTRMKNIEKATRDLIRKLKQVCPKCSYPGFDITQRKPGLPCGWCNSPTTMTLVAVSQCQKCGFSQEVLFPDKLQKADPLHCMYCNP
jgi:hypothetical protein